MTTRKRPVRYRVTQDTRHEFGFTIVSVRAQVVAVLSEYDRIDQVARDPESETALEIRAGKPVYYHAHYMTDDYPTDITVEWQVHKGNPEPTEQQYCSPAFTDLGRSLRDIKCAVAYLGKAEKANALGSPEAFIAWLPTIAVEPIGRWGNYFKRAA